jgi:serine phosphatase RsbU (regulator of sigma subunit)
MTLPAAHEPLSEWIEWGVAGRPFRGETQSGDLHVVAPFEGGVLVAAIDGLGHGIEAAQAAERAAQVLSSEPALPVARLMERCHEALRRSRGAVMTLAAFDVARDRLTWAAIGNVEAALCRAAPGAAPARETIVPRGGVVGYQLPALREASLRLARGDVLVLATDGISHDFILETPSLTSPQGFADHLVDRYAKATDDALVLVVRYLGRSP